MQHYILIYEFLKLRPLTWPYRINTLAGSFLLSILKVEIYSIIYIYHVDGDFILIYVNKYDPFK